MRRTFFRVLVAALLAVSFGLTAPTLAQAQKKQTVASLIKKGQDLFDEQRYEESIQTLSAALLRPGIADEEQIKVFQLLAYNYIVLNRTEEADGAVRGLLVLDENYELPETESPRFRDFFAKIREAWIEEGKPGKDEPVKSKSAAIKHSSPAQVESGLSVSLDGTVEDPEAIVAKVMLYYRTGSSEKFKSLRVKYAMRKFTVEIPAEAVEPPLVEYYFMAVDPTGRPVAKRGDAESPLRIAVPESDSVFTSPWFWVPVSIAVVAAVVIPVVYFSVQSPEATVSVGVHDR